MVISEVIKRLQKIQQREGDVELRIGGYNGSSHEIGGTYHDEDLECAIIY